MSAAGMPLTGPELLAITMYGAGLFLDDDRAAEEFLRQDQAQRDFWVRVACAAKRQVEGEMEGEMEGRVSANYHACVVAGLVRDHEARVAEFERGIVELVLAMARAPAAEMVSVKVKGKVS